jgi:hypothetical protein
MVEQVNFTFLPPVKRKASEEMLVYWTYLEMPNRQAKYVEQLSSTSSRFLSTSVNRVAHRLYAHI